MKFDNSIFGHWRRASIVWLSLGWCVLCCPVRPVSAEDPKLWTAAPDEIYLQEINQKIATPAAVESIACYQQEVWAVSDGRLYELRDDQLVESKATFRQIHLLKRAGDRLWLSSPEGVFERREDGWQKVGTFPVVDVCLHNAHFYFATGYAIYRLVDGSMQDIKPEGGYLSSDSTVVMEDFSQVLADPVRIGPIRRIASYSGTLYILGEHRLSLLDGGKFVPNPIDWGSLPGTQTRDFLSQGSRLVITTDRGLAILRGMAMNTLDSDQGFPLEDTTCLASGFAGDLWIGTSTGVIRMVDGQYHYFGADHWLPADGVHQIAVSDKRVFVATSGGIGIIEYRPYTLQKKAAYFQRLTEKWGHHRMGFVHKLYWSDQHQQWLREISDNDGGHTAHYLAAMSYKFAVTGAEEDRARAVDAFQAMVWLESITPKPGFVARAIWSKQGDLGRRSERGSGGLPAKWYDTDDGLWQWKGDTSSDEISGHMYAVSLFHDLVADDQQKQRAAQHVGAIASHIIDNGWVLRDMDGKPTRWGRWDPEYLQRPYGQISQGLNGLEAQSYMWIAWALTGKPEYKRGLDQLIQWRYHTFTVRQKHAFPPDNIVPWDDELAYRALYPALRYTDDEHLRSIYLRSLERSHEMLRFQKLPHFNFVYGALTGNDCQIKESVEHLREWSLDTISHNYRNSHRRDLKTEPGYRVYTLGTRAISPRESDAKWGSRSAIVYDGGQSSKGVTPAVGWLEDYWMGRYYGFILPADTGDSSPISVNEAEVPSGGAAAYQGPQRPEKP